VRPLPPQGSGLVIIIIGVAVAVVERFMGRALWGTQGIPGMWSGDIWSEHNSQFLFDPYTFTHVSHGMLLYTIAGLLPWKSSARTTVLYAAAVEGLWEIYENTDFVIQRYRTETISLNYFGDSIVNSMGDILACVAGFIIAGRLKNAQRIALIVCLELILLAWTRDNLTLNILMLIHPSAAIRAWQVAR